MQHTSEEFKEFVDNAALEKEIQFEHKGQQFSIPSQEIIQTAFNQGNFHCGQKVMMIRQLRITKIF